MIDARKLLSCRLLILTLLLVGPHLHAADRHASLPAPGTTEGLGTNIHFTDPQPGEVEMLAAGGFRWVRMDFGWAATERTKGQYDFSAYERLLKSLAPHKIRVLFILDYSNSLYEEHRSVATEVGRNAYARWAAAAVTHFKGRGILWEIWNEPNINNFWKPEPNVDDYTTMALEACRAIRRAAPEEAIIGPAAATIDMPFLEKCFEAGLLEWWDAVSVHAYRRSGPETAIPEYYNLKQLITKYAPKKKTIPILSAEWGYSSVWNSFDPDRQGRMLARQWLVNLSNEIPISIWYDWHDDGRDPDEPEHHFGTVKNPFHAGREPVCDPKPAYQAAQTLTSILSGYHFNKRIGTSNPNDLVLLFTKGNQQTLAAWTTEKQMHTVTIPSSPCTFDFVTHVGDRPLSTDVTINEFTFPVSESPVFLIAKKPNPRVLNARAECPLKVGLVPGPGRTFTVNIQHLSESGFHGRVRLMDIAGIDPVADSQPIQIPSLSLSQSVSFPCKSPRSGDASFGLRIEDDAGNIVFARAAQRFVFLTDDLLKACRVVADGDSKIDADVKLQIVPTPAPLNSLSSEVPTVPRLDYRFADGWRFARVIPAANQSLQIPGKPTGFGMWIYGDAQDSSQHCSPRLRVVDSTGQTWQPSGPQIDWTGWKYVEFPLGKGCGHWGGADDGEIHYPVFWDSVFLLDNTSRLATEGKVFVSGPVVMY